MKERDEEEAVAAAGGVAAAAVDAAAPSRLSFATDDSTSSRLISPVSTASFLPPLLFLFGFFLY